MSNGEESAWCDIEVSCGEDKSFTLHADNYANKADFMKEVHQKILDDYGIENPSLRYQCDNANFNASGYVSETDINEHLWALFGIFIDTDDLDLIFAYKEAYGITDIEDPKGLLTKIQEEGLLMGYYPTKSKMAEEYLSRFEDNEGILALTQPYMNLEGVADEILKETGMVVVNDHYFISKEA